MKILMLVNWKVEYGNKAPKAKQPPDYYLNGEIYWFFKYFAQQPEVDVVDISSFKWLENFEQNSIRFYIFQTLKILPKINQYDLIISHGMQSGVVLSLWRRFFKTRAKHIVFDIGSFNSASENGIALKLMQYASKSIDYVIYHTSNQIKYYKKHFPWIAKKSSFIRFGTDLNYFRSESDTLPADSNYILCIGYTKRDWDTLIKAYKLLHTNVKLRLVGHVKEEYKLIQGLEQIPYIPIDQLIDQINHCLFGVLPLESFNYSYGQMTLMQQMALKKCVIASAVPSLTDYCIDNETVLLYEAGDYISLAKKIEQCIVHPELCNEIGNNARKWLEVNCNERIMAKEIEQVINAIVK